MSDSQRAAKSPSPMFFEFYFWLNAEDRGKPKQMGISKHLHLYLLFPLHLYMYLKSAAKVGSS